MHCIRVWAMKHCTAVTYGPSWTTFNLLTNKAVLQTQFIIGVFFICVNMAETIIKLIITVIYYFKHPIFNAKRIRKVFATRIPCNFYCPTCQILSVENGFPLRFRLVLLTRRQCADSQCKCNNRFFHLQKN